MRETSFVSLIKLKMINYATRKNLMRNRAEMM